MKPQPQSFRKQAKKRMIELDLNVTKLATRLGLARNTVNIAINHESMFMPTKSAIRRELGL